MIVCKVCELTPLSKHGICVACCDKLGVVPMPPARRPARPCMRCNAMKFVRVMPREYTAGGADYVQQRAAPMALTHAPWKHTGTFGATSITTPDIKLGHGVLEAYVCRSCEFVEWYCQGVAQIPIGPEYMTEEIDYTPDSPYR